MKYSLVCFIAFVAVCTAEDPVALDVYYESYCPDSKAFVTGQLQVAWDKLGSTGIMNPVLVPYGKAKTIVANGTYYFTCQHGQKECLGNRYQNCAIKYSNNDFKVYHPFVVCMFNHPDGPNGGAKECATNSMLDWNVIEKCANDEEGKKLLADAGELTHGLDPTLTWVPWIVLNKVHTDDIQEQGTQDLVKLVCDAYKGTLPAECGSGSRIIVNWLGFALSLLILQLNLSW